jgi:peroxiredoxin
MLITRFNLVSLTVAVCMFFCCDLFARPQDAALDSTAARPSVAPPKPGPELLNFTPEEIEAAYAGKKIPEAVAMYLVIARGGQLDGKNGWFGPAASRFSWEWLAGQNGIAPDEPLKKDAFHGNEKIFTQLDRDHDGTISGFDLDWSDNNPWVRQSYMVNRMFRRIESGGDGNLTKEEWQVFFEKVAGKDDFFRFEQLRDALIPPGNGFLPGDEPGKETLIQGLMSGEIGSLQEGPSVNDAAPDFELKPLDGGASVRLSDRVGRRPVVLVFGNFTCGPFRSMYSTVEAVRERHKEDADFLLIYVRESHPTNGWAMKSNEKVGVAVSQPKTFKERTAVAEQCAAKLKPSIPLLVDDINDAVGNAYSGMPARLYVIDTHGKVAYKSGRGPFGFKPEEMEQALLMLLLEESSAKPVAVMP